ncbi:hypothetical protein XENOCAPTIV_029536, partial [Xenoophorus captivus]
MEAERAWSYAMQLKQEANTEPRKKFHLLARLRKAAKHSEKLEKLCESPRVDAKTKLEAQALITQARTKQAATMSEVEWRGRTVPVKSDKARIFLLGLADNEAAIAQ